MIFLLQYIKVKNIQKQFFYFWVKIHIMKIIIGLF